MSGFTFRRADADRWHSLHGLAAHPHAQPDLHGLTMTTVGTITVPTAAMAVGIYAVIDEYDQLRYIGKVCRNDPSAIRDRLAHHHAAAPDWYAVWLLPLRDRCPNPLVEVLESHLIRAYRPCDNTQHSRPRALA